MLQRLLSPLLALLLAVPGHAIQAGLGPRAATRQVHPALHSLPLRAPQRATTPPTRRPSAFGLGSRWLSAPIRFDGERRGKDAEPTTELSGSQTTTDSTGDSPLPKGGSEDFARMLEITRRALTRPEVRKFLREELKDELVVDDKAKEQNVAPEDLEKIKDVSENQFMLLLMYNEKHWGLVEKYLDQAEKADEKDKELPADVRTEWRAAFRELLRDEDIRRKFDKLNDPFKPLRLEWRDGRAGYENTQVRFDHQMIVDGEVRPASDLKAWVIEYIDGAEEDLMFNVFDFDLMDVADAFVRAGERGVNVLGGIDGKLIDEESDSYRPEVKAVFDKLNKAKGVKIVAVDAVGLNHQKMIMRDYKNKAKAKALFSSGNFTQSCIGPEGDLCDVPAAERPKDSVPNANHITIMDSYLLAQVAAHNMIKTLEYGLRGRDFPLSGGMKVFGANNDESGERPYIVATFTPGGGLGDVNRDLTRRLLLNTRGPVRLMQFAFSSSIVEEALIERAKLEIEENGSFDFKSIGDTPFATQFWSVFLSLIGYAVEEAVEGVKRYVELADAPLRKILGEEGFAAFRAAVRIGPAAYRNHHLGERQYGAKIHHKVILSGLFAVFGTSFNFSEAANSNQEQYLVTNDPAIVRLMYAGFDGLYALAKRSLEEEVLGRNERNEGADSISKQYQHVEREGRASYEARKAKAPR